MLIKGILSEDFVNYKVPCMTIMMPKCDFKCDREAGCQVCQNMPIARDPDIIVNIENMLDRYYFENDITGALVFQGLEPFDTIEDLCDCIEYFSNKCNDDIVIYTGYNENEIADKIKLVKDSISGSNKLIIKFGRYIPGQEPHHDNILGVDLASNNQYTKIVLNG